MDTLRKKALEGSAQFLIAMLVFIFLPAWTLRYWQGWLFWGVFAISVLFITLYFLKKDPALIQRRMKAGPKDEQRKSQKIIQGFASICFLAVCMLPGFDHRLGRSAAMPAWLNVLGAVLVTTGFLIIFFVFKENSYTSGVVEVATDQKVISTGPYSIVRHPMYSGAVLLFIGAPLTMASYWALIPGILLIAIMIIRLLDEEQFLIGHLPGYPEYRQKTRYRLVPMIW